MRIMIRFQRDVYHVTLDRRNVHLRHVNTESICVVTLKIARRITHDMAGLVWLRCSIVCQIATQTLPSKATMYLFHIHGAV